MKRGRVQPDHNSKMAASNCTLDGKHIFSGKFGLKIMDYLSRRSIYYKIVRLIRNCLTIHILTEICGIFGQMVF